MTRFASGKTANTTIWVTATFYFVIALEFFYMATPFAAFFYSAYLPGLEALNRSPWTAWLTTFYLPHFAPATSMLVNGAPAAGTTLVMIGLSGFMIGAVQVYSRKLRRLSAATGGLYRFVRHPQYAFLILAGAGMLLRWPRYLMIVFFVTMLFAYFGLALIEERECARKYGRAYVDYRNRTPRFLPFGLASRRTPFFLTASPLMRIAAGLVLYVALTAIGLGAAALVQSYTIKNLIVQYRGNSAFIAVHPMTSAELRNVVESASDDPRVRERANTPGDAAFINYVLPRDWAVTEIPMNGAVDHQTPEQHDSRYKIVYTRATLCIDRPTAGPDILQYSVHTKAAFEAWLDDHGRVERIMDPPEAAFYGAVPVPIY